MEKILFFLLIPVLLDLLFGDPIGIPHPIIYIGKLISFYEKWIRKSNVNLKAGGFLLLGVTIITVMSIITVIQLLLGKVSLIFQTVFTIYFLYTSLASKCLANEGEKVYQSLLTENIIESRKKLSYLVGRDTTTLLKDQVIKGTVETVAENTIDGVLAPLMFIAIGICFGYPLQFAYVYKTINTLDSMVGYNNEKYGDLGFASAKSDDLMNLIPARIGSLGMLLSGVLLNYNFKCGLKILTRDKRNHKSPNCAYPEAVIAGLLDIELGGTHTYFGEEVYKPTIGDDNRSVREKDILDTIDVMYVSEIVILLVSLIVLLFIKI